MNCIKRSLPAVCLAALLALVLAGCGSSSSSAGSDPSGGHSVKNAAPGFQTIRYQTVPGVFDPIEFASYLGYLPGIPIDHVGTVLGGPQDIQAVATGSSDIGGAFNGSIIAAIAAGAKLKAVIGYYGSDQNSYGGVYVKQGSSITSAKDLIGKSVAVNTLGANDTEVTDLWLAKQGLSAAEIKKVDFVVVNPTEAAEALKEGRVDAAYLSFASRQLAAKTLKLHQLMTDIGQIGNYTAGSDVLRPSFIAQNPKETKELVAGIAKAVHWLQVTPRAQVIKVGEKIAALHGRASTDDSWIPSWKSQGVSEPYGYISRADFARWIAPMEIAGQIKKGQISASQVYTNAYNPHPPS